jgi:hypothetical protein
MSLDQQANFLAAFLAIALGTGLCWLGHQGLRAWRRRQLRISAAKLNDCKPGCFMMNKGDTE